MSRERRGGGKGGGEEKGGGEQGCGGWSKRTSVATGTTSDRGVVQQVGGRREHDHTLWRVRSNHACQPKHASLCMPRPPKKCHSHPAAANINRTSEHVGKSIVKTDRLWSPSSH